MAYSSYDGWVTLQGSKCKCNCIAMFSLRSKSSTLVCIFGDGNMRLLFTSWKKMTSVLLSRYVCSYLDLIICFAIDSLTFFRYKVLLSEIFVK